jgi:hypothetical protein
MNRSRLALFSMLSLLAVKAENVQYIRVNAAAYDLAVVVTPVEFSPGRIQGRMEAFAGSQATRHKLSRLTLAPRDVYLGWALPAGDGSYVNPNFARTLSRQQSVAQVICLDGIASGFIKLGNVVTSIQVRGKKDPRDLSLDGKRVQLISFQIMNGGGVGLDQMPGPGTQAMLEFYVKSSPMISVAEARQVWSKLAASVGLTNIFLYVRPDTLFVAWGGPRFDVFHLPFPDVPKAVYLDVPYVTCAPGRKRQKGAPRVSCTMSSLAKHPRSPWAID